MKKINELYDKFKTTANKNSIQSGTKGYSEQKYFHQQLKALPKQKKNKNNRRKTKTNTMENSMLELIKKFETEN